MANQSWSALFKASSSKLLDTSLELFKPVFSDGLAEVPPEIIEEGLAEWNDVVVGFFVDKKLPFKLVKDSLVKIWNLKGIFSVTTDKELFYFSFSDEEDRKKVIEGGPVFIAGRLFVVRKWTEEVEMLRSRVNTMPVWINLYHLPKTLWTKKGISFVASLIGYPLFCDATTFKKERLEFARVCVEISSEHQFEKSVRMKMGDNVVAIGVEYPWKPPCCSYCSCFGHKTTNCAKAPAKKWVTKDPKGSNNQGLVHTEAGSSGSKEMTSMELVMMPAETEVMPFVNNDRIESHVKGVDVVLQNQFVILGNDKEVEEEVSQLVVSKTNGEVVELVTVEEGELNGNVNVGEENSNSIELAPVMGSFEEEVYEPHIEEDIQQYEAEKEHFLEGEDHSEDELESEDNSEPEYFHDHLPQKMSVKDAKRVARGKSEAVNDCISPFSAGKIQPMLPVLCPVAGSHSNTGGASNSVKRARSRPKGPGKEGVPLKPFK
ncbi:zinc ion binding / nucleic acid binding protein [Thalictrum thalictroides]|uniref:Zinc ion binding / nucleic acid binding protein n=1 Tax=Thalictrum thalictroides TaxID=46969 RepID=A0A7J6WPW4_THATH|nr:zinc ion binding / nucleic acid binding protein [Thalictrum thalictroides]